MTEDRRCGTCRFFRRPWARRGATCEDQGEFPNSAPCPQYAPEVINVGALPFPEYRDVFHEILAESFVLEQDLKLAVDSVAAQLQAQGSNISLRERRDNDPEFRLSGERLTDLYVVYRLVLAIGLGRYADEIMTAEIARRFGK